MGHYRLAFLTVILLATQVLAQSPPASGWIPLFDGKDFKGWKINGDEKWEVENGTIFGESTQGKYSYLTTEKSYSDFVLRLKFKCESTGNSGVFLRSHITGESSTGPDIEGMQVEIDPTRHTGGLYESGRRGWVALPSPAGEKAIKPNDWNDLEIAAEGSHYVTRLNGIQIVDYDDPDPKFTSGVIGLQLHTGGGVKIQFKDIFIRLLSQPFGD